MQNVGNHKVTHSIEKKYEIIVRRKSMSRRERRILRRSARAVKAKFKVRIVYVAITPNKIKKRRRLLNVSRRGLG